MLEITCLSSFVFVFFIDLSSDLTPGYQHSPLLKTYYGLFRITILYLLGLDHAFCESLNLSKLTAVTDILVNHEFSFLSVSFKVVTQAFLSLY